ncbi:hypothetical protein AeRB84_020470 [Aphanomyces euteiches]|nr:hypothetical protein AeRB84_020470 [Aphanomyces euteiches]
MAIFALSLLVVVDILNSPLYFDISGFMTRFIKAKPEVLRLYREILRTARQFQWTNEKGEPWSKILKQNARMEIEHSRHDTDSEVIARKILSGWESLHQVQEKIAEKAKSLHDQARDQK